MFAETCASGRPVRRIQWFAALMAQFMAWRGRPRRLDLDEMPEARLRDLGFLDGRPHAPRDPMRD